LAKWDVNHDGENGCETLLQENQTYVGNDHHDEDVSHIQSVKAQSGALVNQNHTRDGQIHERTEVKHESKSEAKHENKIEAEHENKNEAENQ
jgi:hypothetical protein